MWGYTQGPGKSFGAELTYAAAEAYLSRAQRPECGRPLAGNTRLHRLTSDGPYGGMIAVRLHSTNIVTYCEDGSLILNSGGWHTLTTTARMHEYTPGYAARDGGTLCYWPDGPPHYCREHRQRQGYRYTATEQGYRRDGRYPPCCTRQAGRQLRGGEQRRVTPAGKWDDGPMPVEAAYPVLTFSPKAPPVKPKTHKPKAYGKSSPFSFPTAGWGKPPATDYGVSGAVVTSQLGGLVPGLAERVPCPEPDGCVSDRLADMVIHLNDYHEWSREQIADWLETLDVDIRFTSAA